MEIIVTGVRTITSGKTKITEEIEYNILEGVASVYTEDEEEPYEVSSDLFTKDIKKVIRLAVKEIDFYKAKVDNNKIVIGMSEGKELDKAIRHMAINQDKLDAIDDFIKSAEKR
jgi:histidinol phosphatase-like PHP family hydrolase